ncbi:hypothetical protein AOLI_G00018350 [Acnodon oligacanthus]
MLEVRNIMQMLPAMIQLGNQHPTMLYGMSKMLTSPVDLNFGARQQEKNISNSFIGAWMAGASVTKSAIQSKIILTHHIYLRMKQLYPDWSGLF